jgi:transketolase
MRSFGHSAPIKALQTAFGFTLDHVLEAARRQIAKSKSSSQP